MLVKWGQLGRVQVLFSSPSVRRKNAKTRLMPSRLNFTTVVCHCCTSHCFELHLFFFFFGANSFQNEVSGLCLVSLSAHIGLWNVLGIYNRGMIDNHFIPCSYTVCKRTMQQAMPETLKYPFFTWEEALISKSYRTKLCYLTSQSVDIKQ